MIVPPVVDAASIRPMICVTITGNAAVQMMWFMLALVPSQCTVVVINDETVGRLVADIVTSTNESLAEMAIPGPAISERTHKIGLAELPAPKAASEMPLPTEV